MPELILASSSPRRVELLNQLNLVFRIVPPDIDETLLRSESHLKYVSRMSREKAETVFASEAKNEDNNGGNIVLSGDTVVIVDGELLGKPIDENDAIDMLQRLSDNTHQVITSISVMGKTKKNVDGVMNRGKAFFLETLLVTTNVRFRSVTVDECKSYWRTGEPVDKAGGYGIQGLGAIFVESLEGSYSNVVGLPLAETAQLLSVFGVECLLVHENVYKSLGETKLLGEVVRHG